MLYVMARWASLPIRRAEPEPEPESVSVSSRRVEWSATASAAAERRPTSGVRVDEGAIRLHVERARKGEALALGELFDGLRPDVLRLCRRLLGPVDAEDAANEVFLRAQGGLTGYDEAQPFRRWLLSVASHHCIDQLRRRSVEKRLFEPGESDVEELAGRDPSALEAVVRSESQAAVQAALERLPERYRAPLVLRYFAELGYDAIGQELGLERAQVATLLFRGKQRLRDLLRARSESGSESDS